VFGRRLLLHCKLVLNFVFSFFFTWWVSLPRTDTRNYFREQLWALLWLWCYVCQPSCLSLHCILFLWLNNYFHFTPHCFEELFERRALTAFLVLAWNRHC
jgi:hypothetical protein